MAHTVWQFPPWPSPYLSSNATNALLLGCILLGFTGDVGSQSIDPNGQHQQLLNDGFDQLQGIAREPLIGRLLKVKVASQVPAVLDHLGGREQGIS